MDAQLSKTARRILRYLNEHPEAQDTLEGISRWWLLDLHIEEQLDAVEAALEELAAAGLVVATPTADGRRHYRLSRHRRDQIRAVLAGHEVARGPVVRGPEETDDEETEDETGEP